MIYLYRNNYQYHKDLESFYVYLKVTNLGNFWKIGNLLHF